MTTCPATPCQTESLHQQVEKMLAEKKMVMLDTIEMCIRDRAAAFARVLQIKKAVLEVFPDKGKVEEGAQGDVQPRAAHNYKCAARRADG